MNSTTELNSRITELEHQLAIKSSEWDDIANMGIMLTSMLDVDAVLSAMMEMSLRIVSAEVGCILLSENDSLITRTSWGVDAALIRNIPIPGGRDIAEAVFQDCETRIVNDFEDSFESEAVINSIICVPISYGSDPLGVLIAVNKTSNEGFCKQDREVLERLVNFAAAAIQNARMMKELLKQQRFEQELSLAREIQKALLPSLDLKIKGVAVESLYVPAGKVGGDYFDLIPVSETEFFVIVGDVSNKGVPAALMMTAARSAIRAEVARGNDVATIVTRVNNILCQDVMKYPNIFISFCLAHFNLANSVCTYTNAGHLPPILHNRRTGQVRELKTGGTIVGQFEEFEFQDESISMNPGDRMLLYTDGATECTSATGEMYGKERLAQLFTSMKDNRPDEALRNLIDDINDFTRNGDEANTDDLTAVVVEIEETSCE